MHRHHTCGPRCFARMVFPGVDSCPTVHTQRRLVARRFRGEAFGGEAGVRSRAGVPPLSLARWPRDASVPGAAVLTPPPAWVAAVPTGCPAPVKSSCVLSQTLLQTEGSGL